MFTLPGVGGSGGPGGNTREYATLVILTVFLLAILGFRSFIRADRTMVQSQYAVPDAADQSLRTDADDPIRRTVLQMRRERGAQGDAPEAVPAAPGLPGAAQTPAGEAEGPSPWARRPDEILVRDGKWLVESEREDEAKAAAFLPPVEEFRKLEPMAVLAWRTRVLDAVSSGDVIACVLPGGAGESKAVAADTAGITLAGADGAPQKTAWTELPAGALFALASAWADRSGEKLNAEEWMQLGHLAELAGQADARAKYMAKAVALDSSLAGATDLPPAVALDLRVLDEYSWTWDVLTDPEPAASLGDDAPSILHAYRYMRTVGLDRLRAEALHNPEYAPLVNRPAQFRGKTIRFEGRYVKRFSSLRMTGVKGWEGAGIRDLDFCFVVDARVRGIYLISAPQDLRTFRDSDIVTFTGVYVRRWPYQRHGDWRWVPWIAAHSISLFEVAPARGLRTMTYLLVTGGAVLFCVIAYYARRDARESIVVRDQLHRMRGGRDHIRRKVAEALAASGAAPGGRTAGDAPATQEPGPPPAPPGGAPPSQESGPAAPGVR